MTVSRPNQEWRLQRLGSGQVSPSLLGCLQGFKLCESKTAFKAITAHRNADIMIPACNNFNFRFRSFRNIRYMSIPGTENFPILHFFLMAFIMGKYILGEKDKKRYKIKGGIKIPLTKYNEFSKQNIKDHQTGSDLYQNSKRSKLSKCLHTYVLTKCHL